MEGTPHNGSLGKDNEELGVGRGEDVSDVEQEPRQSTSHHDTEKCGFVIRRAVRWGCEWQRRRNGGSSIVGRKHGKKEKKQRIKQPRSKIRRSKMRRSKKRRSKKRRAKKYRAKKRRSRERRAKKRRARKRRENKRREREQRNKKLPSWRRGNK